MHTGVHFGESDPHKTNRFIPVLHVVIVRLHAVDRTDSSFIADAPSAANGISGLNASSIPCREFGPPYMGKATAAARAALPIPGSVQYFRVSRHWHG